MPETPNGSVTVDSQEFEPTPEALPAQEPEQGGEAARPEAGATTDKPSSEATDWQEELAREKQAREKAERALREQQSRAARLQAEAERLRQDTLRDVERQIAEVKQSMDYRLQQGEIITQADLDRRDALLEQRFRLMQNTQAYVEHETKRTEYAEKLREKTQELGWSDDQHMEFLARHSVQGRDPMTGQFVSVPFGQYNDPAQAYDAAMAFLHYETKDEYENKVRQTEAEKLDKLNKQKLRQSLPNAAPPKQAPPPSPEDAYKAAIKQAGERSNPDSWF